MRHSDSRLLKSSWAKWALLIHSLPHKKCRIHVLAVVKRRCSNKIQPTENDENSEWTKCTKTKRRTTRKWNDATIEEGKNNYCIQLQSNGVVKEVLIVDRNIQGLITFNMRLAVGCWLHGMMFEMKFYWPKRKIRNGNIFVLQIVKSNCQLPIFPHCSQTHTHTYTHLFVLFLLSCRR